MKPVRIDAPHNADTPGWARAQCSSSDRHLSSAGRRLLAYLMGSSGASRAPLARSRCGPLTFTGQDRNRAEVQAPDRARARWLNTRKERGMRSPLRVLTAVAAVTCAAASAGPTTWAAAAPSAANAAGGTPLPFPGLSCGVNQGLPPGIPNVGPTGPLGPLGSSGPLGGGSGNLPCGASALNLGPSGPLGPGGALGSGQGPSSASHADPAPQASRVTHRHPSGKRTSGKHAGHGRPPGHRRPGHRRH
jgi:hypothetical protein